MPSSTRAATRAGLGVLASFALLILGLAYIYRPLLASGMISGVETDTLIQVAILQNWSNCLSGYGSCLSPNYFYPLDRTLGYNDGYFISGVLFHAFRLGGFDPLISYELVYVVVRAIGFAGVIALGIRHFGLPAWAAIFAAWLSLIAINLLNQIVHTQLIYAGFVPAALFLLLSLIEASARLDAPGERRPWRAVTLAFALGLFCAAWAVTAFYSFFFFLFFTILFVPVYALVRWRHVSRAFANCIARPAVAAALCGSAALAPLALWIVYGRTMRESGGHAWSTEYNPRLYDLFNVGPDNLVWSSVLAPLYRALSGRAMQNTELSVGFPPLFIFCLILGLLYLRALHRPAHAKTERAAPANLAALLATAIAAVLSMLLIVRVGARYTAWQFFWVVLPGASAIRVPARFFIFVTPLLCLVVAFAVSRLHRGPQTLAWRIAALAGVMAALTIEQYDLAPEFKVDREAELAALHAVPPPPTACRAFYVSAPRRGPYGSEELDVYYVHSVDAMLVAALYRIPTINGMASILPRGWDLEAPFRPDYRERVRRYAERHGISEGLCSLDLKAGSWALG